MLQSWSAGEAQPNSVGCQLWCNTFHRKGGCTCVCTRRSIWQCLCVCVCVCPSVFKDGSSDLAGASAPWYTMKTRVGSRTTSIALIHECDKCTTIFRLHRPPTGPLYFAFFFFFLPTLLLRGTEKCFSFPPSSVELWWTNCEARVVYKGVGNKTRNNVEKWAPQLVSAKQLMLLAVGKSARGQNPSLVLLSRRV